MRLVVAAVQLAILVASINIAQWRCLQSFIYHCSKNLIQVFAYAIFRLQAPIWMNGWHAVCLLQYELCKVGIMNYTALYCTKLDWRVDSTDLQLQSSVLQVISSLQHKLVGVDSQLDIVDNDNIKVNRCRTSKGEYGRI